MPTSPRTLSRRSLTRPDTEPPRRSGLDWLLSEQEADGSWFGRWGVNHVYGTGAAVPALEACGLPPEHPAIRRALSWLDSVQQPSGAFGEDIASYCEPAGPRSWRRDGFPNGLGATRLRLGRCRYRLVHAAWAKYLCETQRGDGDWDERHFTGTGFPLDFMIRYHLYRLTFPLLALGRLRERLNG